MLKLFIFIYLTILEGNEDMWTLVNLEILLRNGNFLLNYKIMVIIPLLMTTDEATVGENWSPLLLSPIRKCGSYTYNHVGVLLLDCRFSS